jgi:hypothetical protein
VNKNYGLLKEYTTITTDKDLLKEYASNPSKPVTVVGVIQRADAKNQNGRIYPHEILRKEVDRYINEVIKEGVAVGELDHRDTPEVQWKNASHLIEDVWWDGPEKKDLYGRIRLLNTPSGHIARNIVLEGIPLGISSRAVGSLSRNESKGADIVGEDLNIVCWDLVPHPSTQKAFLAMNESYDPRKNIPREHRIKSTLRELLKKA